jgi:hypothetical protein
VVLRVLPSLAPGEINQRQLAVQFARCAVANGNLANAVRTRGYVVHLGRVRRAQTVALLDDLEQLVRRCGLHFLQINNLHFAASILADRKLLPVQQVLAPAPIDLEKAHANIERLGPAVTSNDTVGGISEQVRSSLCPAMHAHLLELADLGKDVGGDLLLNALHRKSLAAASLAVPVATHGMC